MLSQLPLQRFSCWILCSHTSTAGKTQRSCTRAQVSVEGKALTQRHVELLSCFLFPGAGIVPDHQNGIPLFGLSALWKTMQLFKCFFFPQSECQHFLHQRPSLQAITLTTTVQAQSLSLSLWQLVVDIFLHIVTNPNNELLILMKKWCNWL